MRGLAEFAQKLFYGAGAHRQETGTKQLTATRQGAVRQQTRQQTVRLDQTPHDVARGWKRGKKGHTGFFRTKYGAYAGMVTKSGDRLRVYIYDPPMDQIETDPYSACFYHKKDDLWEINLKTQPEDGKVASVVMKVETYITQCCEQWRRGETRDTRIL